jgi:trans-2,3-dihydro-3-hydroxyanthranilate isomerase
VSDPAGAGAGAPADSAASIEGLRGFDPLAAPGPVAPGAGAAGRLPYVLLDVFSAVPLAGNQLAIFTDARGLDDVQMQRLARELQLSETVFVLPADGPADVRVRIFTPTAELPFAGHPTLGAAVLVASALGRQAVSLQTGVGVIGARVERGEDGTLSGTVSQPIPSWSDFADARALLAALGVEGSQLPVECYENGPRHVLVALGGADEVAALRPDLGALSELGELGVSCFAASGERWKTRMFAPSLGVAEDPATGSAAGPLAVHLARHGRIAFGERIEIEQGAEIGRPSLLYARAQGGHGGLEAVEVGGAVVAVARGEFAFPPRPVPRADL